MNITTELLQTIKDLDLSIQEYLILYSKYNKTNWTVLIGLTNDEYLGLIGRGYLTKLKTITVKGRDVIKQQNEQNTTKTTKIKETFAEWWEEFPRHDGFGQFPRSIRNIRTGKPEAERLYKRILEGGNTEDNLLRGLRNEVKTRMDLSTRRGENLLKYIKSPTRWLREEDWLNFLDIEEIKPNEHEEYGKEVE